MKAVITGPTGAIGMALIKKCIQENIQVIAICHRGSKRLSNIPSDSHVKVVEANLSELGDAHKIIDDRDCDVFYHFAWSGTTGEARNDMYLQTNNIKYTMDAVELASMLGCKCFIGAGSQAEYGRVEGLLGPDTPVSPENGYGMAKLCAGQMSRLRCKELGICHIWTRILSVYGPYDGENSMITSAIKRLINGERAGFTPAGQKWDYLYSDDAANAMYLLGARGSNAYETGESLDGRIYVIGSGHVAPLREYIEMLAKEVSELTKRECELGFGDIPYSKGQVMYLGADISELKRDTGFVPQTDFKTGISKTVKFLATGRSD